MRKYKFGWKDGKFILIRKFSFFHWLFGYEKRECPHCKNVAYWSTGGILDYCLECGYNKTWKWIDELLKNKQ